MSGERLYFPRSARLLKGAEYRKVYQEGRKFVSSLFAVFYRLAPLDGTARVGWSTPRALGKAVVRNRIKRRLREAVRLELSRLPPGWEVVFHPRRSAGEADFSILRNEVARFFDRLGTQRRDTAATHKL